MNAPDYPATAPANAVAVCALPIDQILPSRSNPRKHFDDAYLAELAESIKSHGLIQPITVRPLSLDALLAFNRTRKDDGTDHPSYELVVGECRWRAAKLAGLAEIPAFWRELDDKQVLEIQVVENLQRRDVHPIEEAEGYQALIARHGYTADTLAAKIGKSRAYVYARLKLAALTPAVREEFFAGKLEASTALLIARIPGEALQKKAAKEVIHSYNGEPLSYRAAKQHIHSRYTLSLKRATFRPDDATLLPAAGACSACPKLSGNFHDLFNDIEDADVCTDPDCFEAKRQARREHLIANAERRKIPVFLGDQGREATRAEIQYVSLDAEVDDDGEGRTYRQILGDKVKPEALIEFPYGKKDLTECVPLNTLEAALRKAGWEPAEEQPYVPPDATPEQKKAAEAQAAKRKAETEEWERKKEAAERENTWRNKLATEVLRRVELDTNNGDLNTDRAIILLAHAWLAQCDLEYEFPEDLCANYGIELPAEYDSADEMPRIYGIMEKWRVGTALAFLLDALTAHTERNIFVNRDTTIQPPRILLATAALVGLDAEVLREPPPATAKVQPKTAKSKAAKPAPTPSDAAHASDVSAQPAAPAEEPKAAKKPAAKKAKAKADPAPASPANEAASPLKTSALPAWPFPTGARP